MVIPNVQIPSFMYRKAKKNRKTSFSWKKSRKERSTLPCHYEKHDTALEGVECTFSPFCRDVVFIGHSQMDILRGGKEERRVESEKETIG